MKLDIGGVETIQVPVEALWKALNDPDAALAAMYYDIIVQDPRALRYLADIVGPERIMMGSDMPFPIGDLAPTNIVAETKFTDAERAAINGGLAARLFGL